MAVNSIVAAGAGAAPRRRGRRARGRTRWAGWAFVGPFLVVFAFALIVPIGYAIYLSLFRQQLIGGNAFVGLSNYKARAERPAVLGVAAPHAALPRRAGAGHDGARAARRARAGQRPAALGAAVPAVDLPAVRRPRRGRVAHVGLHLRVAVRPRRQAAVAARRALPRPVQQQLGARLDRQRRDLGVRRLQHADLLLGAAGGARRTVRGGGDRRRDPVRDHPLDQAARAPGRDRGLADLLGHRQPAAVQRAGNPALRWRPTRSP